MDGPGTEPAATTYTIDDLFETMVALGASDLHVTVGSHPVIRLNGSLQRLDQFPRLSADAPREPADRLGEDRALLRAQVVRPGLVTVDEREREGAQPRLQLAASALLPRE